MEKMMTLESLCREISISVATGKNWLKLGKIKPQIIQDNIAYFSETYVMDLKKNIQSGVSTALKSRRNKKYISGNGMYHAYVSDKNKNVASIENVLKYIHEYEIALDTELLQLLIADCAVKLMLQRMDVLAKTAGRNDGLLSFLNKETSFCEYNSLIEDLIEDKEHGRELIDKYEALFSQEYFFDEKEDILGLFYISGNSLTSRKAAGSYYTPTKVVRKAVEQFFLKNNFGKSILDPCCGTGNFLLQLPDGYSMDKIYGNDIDAISIKIARINMAIRFMGCDVQLIQSHIVQKDHLLGELEYPMKKYDYIIGNPPWGCVYTEEEKKYIHKHFQSACNHNIESFDLFVEKCLSLLKKDGVLSFILPESILNVKTHKPVREILVKQVSVQYIEFLGDIFDGVQCPSIILQMKNTQLPMTCKGMTVRRNHEQYQVEIERTIGGDSFDFSMTDEEYCLMKKIYEKDHCVYLKNQAKFALGIITGDNKGIISEMQTEDNERILKGSDIDRYRIKEKNRYIEYKPENFQQVAPEAYYRAPEKLLYKFISNQLIFAYDDKQHLSLNSCNIVIPKIDGMSMKYILAILNSTVAQFIYEKRFHSVKVLRGHIEQIPIPVPTEKEQQLIISYVDMLLAISRLQNQEEKENAELQKKYDRIYGLIDRFVAKCFLLTDEEYREICEHVGIKDDLIAFA